MCVCVGEWVVELLTCVFGLMMLFVFGGKVVLLFFLMLVFVKVGSVCVFCGTISRVTL